MFTDASNFTAAENEVAASTKDLKQYQRDLREKDKEKKLLLKTVGQVRDF